MSEHGVSDEPAAPTTAELLNRLLDVRRSATERERAEVHFLASLPPDRRAGAANLLHYLAMREFDLRIEQRALAHRGLSSLGRSEAHVLASIDAVLTHLAAAEPGAARLLPDDLRTAATSAERSERLLAAHAEEVLGPRPDHGDTRVMVTLPTEAADDLALVRGFVDAGMAIARINCAHDDARIWQAMADNVHKAAADAGRTVRIACDLAGPKLRTSGFEPGPSVVKAKPERDALGRVLAPAVVHFVGSALDADPVPLTAQLAAPPTIPLTGSIVALAQPGDEIRLRDARGRKRRFSVRGRGRDASCWAQGEQTAYLTPDLDVTLHRNGGVVAHGTVGDLPATEGFARLAEGDRLELVLGDHPGRGADGRPACVSVAVPELFAALEVGHRVLFDDGKLRGVVVEADADRALVEMTHDGSHKLRSEKGINVPDSRLRLASVTDVDLAALETVAPFADLVALSFVDDPGDVARVHHELDRLGVHDTGIVLKIERRSAFEALPRLLLHALRRPPVAVMVARGDLAVEVGFERLAELQEEILWLCEAAHVPAIWATQVLETLAKEGAPTRAEVTDAAWACRAECVMLNKGPHIPEAMAMLDDILGRMHGHQDKRVPLLRPLSVARQH